MRILAVCGLRPAEIPVLRIEDFEGTQLRIDEALKERLKGEDRIGETKTAESDNYVPVPPDLAREIATWIAGRPDRGNPSYANASTPSAQEPRELLELKQELTQMYQQQQQKTQIAQTPPDQQ